MDNSQSSDFIDDDADLQTASFSDKQHISYDSLLTTTKEAFSDYKNEIQKSTFSTYFSTVLENSWTCITHSLDILIRELLSDTSVPITKIVDYLNDSVFLLQMLSDFYKSIIESVSMSCCTMKTLPRQTGLIIFSVFVHCRDSESLYRHQLKSVEKQLKDLFRICHELQLTYLLVLEKHFNFNLTEMDDKTILIEALKINLSIGKVVQALDVKTMAEQWKAYTVICEKYSSSLIDTDVFQECTQVICALVKDNIETALQKSHDDYKVTIRSLKVASFTIKILMKICNIFKLSSNKNYSHIVELLRYMINSTHLEMSSENKLTSLMNANIVTPSDSLLKELLCDEEFLNCIFNSASNGKDMKNEDILVLLLLITSAMKCTTQTNRIHQNSLKVKLVTCVYSLLPYSCMSFRRRLFIESNQVQHTIFEHMLIHTTVLALTMSNEEFNALEKQMIEAILGTEFVSALFSSNLWIILTSYISPQLLFNQLIWLCTMYKKLGAHTGFYRSPQDIHLGHTLSRLFKVLEDEDKSKFCKQFRIHDEDNITLWSALRIRNLPADAQQKAEEVITEKLYAIFGRLHDTDSPDLLIQITNLAATCTFETTKGIEDHVVRAWSKTCQRKQSIVQGLDNDTVWFYDYVNALVALTDSAITRLKEGSDNYVKVLHVISGLTKTGDTEMKLLLTNILCKLSTCNVIEHRNLIESDFTEAFTCLLKDSDDIVRNNLLRKLRHEENSYLDGLVISIVRDYSLPDIWENFERYDAKVFDANDLKFEHKCLCSKNIVTSAISVQELKEANLDNFYFDSGSSDMMVEAEMNEPSSKRGKPNTHEADSIIKSLEDNVSLLVRQTVSTDQSMRIRNVCEKLLNICNN